MLIAWLANSLRPHTAFRSFASAPIMPVRVRCRGDEIQDKGAIETNGVRDGGLGIGLGFRASGS